MQESAVTLGLTTPALLFPAISLLLLAYGNRFVVLATVIRQLAADEKRVSAQPELLHRQVDSLRKRLVIIRHMQAFGVGAFILCTSAMIALFADVPVLGHWLFGASLVSLIVSLVLSLYEIQISTVAIGIELERIAKR